MLISIMSAGKIIPIKVCFTPSRVHQYRFCTSVFKNRGLRGSPIACTSNLINLWTRLQVDFVVVSTKIHIVSFSPLTLALNHQCVGSLARLSG